MTRKERRDRLFKALSEAVKTHTVGMNLTDIVYCFIATLRILATRGLALDGDETTQLLHEIVIFVAEGRNIDAL